VRGVRGPVDGGGVALALLIAATIAAYTLVDNEGIEHASAIPYLELVLLPVALSALVLHVSAGRVGALRAELGWSSVAAGACSFAAYALALAALSLAPAAAVAAVRETGILFAVALGLVVLREPVGRERAVGAVLVVGGVALVALG
jgi:drug/metabolite transporter (DMT)-like permease